MKLTPRSSNVDTKHDDQRATYEAPAIIHESVISTRAGSPLSSPDDPGNTDVDPADLFGDD